jgi:hypothetical protein
MESRVVAKMVKGFFFCGVSQWSSHPPEEQGCPIFLGTTYQNGINIYQNNKKIHQMAIKYTKWQ